MNKRLFDIALSAIGLVILFPLFIIIMLVVRIKIGSPVLFVQTRPGVHAKPFQLTKFRTMTDQRDESGALLPDDIRLTRFGKWLRATSLDEIPELWNVLKGDMSLVGPRPLLMEYLPLYSREQARRHTVRPGITGWAQINGRNALSWEEKFDFDVWYVDNQNFRLDMKILLMTIKTLIWREGISHSGEATMPRFEGPGDERRDK
jgi:sugar transferase EpsL